MMNFSSDYTKYLKKLNINEDYSKSYINKSSSMINSMDNSFSVIDKLLDNRIIFLTGEIDDYLCDFIKANILYLESLDSKKDIIMYINSPGGSVYSGLGLLDVMDFVTPDIVTINTGLAASMGAVILCSGAKGKRRALKRSRTMIHQPMTGFGSYAQATDIEIESREINSIKRELYEIISENTGQYYDKVFKDGDRDYWMSAQDAKKYGMVDEIIQKRDSKKTKG